MNKLEEFKDFVRQNPYLKTAVDLRKITWQKAYETYDLFGENASDFELIRESLQPKIEEAQVAPAAIPTTTNAYDIMSILSAVDFNKVSSTIDQLKKIVGVVKDLAVTEEPKENKSRRIFRRFND